MMFSFLVNNPQTLVSLHFTTLYGNDTMGGCTGSGRKVYSDSKKTARQTTHFGLAKQSKNKQYDM